MTRCGLKGCKRHGVLKVLIFDLALTSYERVTPRYAQGFCCKTHMLRVLSKKKMPRYSKKRVQSLVETMPLKFDTKENSPAKTGELSKESMTLDNQEALK